jgi:hypothetical protein
VWGIGKEKVEIFVSRAGPGKRKPRFQGWILILFKAGSATGRGTHDTTKQPQFGGSVQNYTLRVSSMAFCIAEYD